MNQIGAYDSYELFKRKLYVFMMEKGGDPEYNPVIDVMMKWASEKEKEVIEENQKSRVGEQYNPYWDYSEGACRIYQMCRRGEVYEQGRYYAYDPSNPYWKDFEAFLNWEQAKRYDPHESLSQIAARTERTKQAIWQECQEFLNGIGNAAVSTEDEQTVEEAEVRTA